MQLSWLGDPEFGAPFHGAKLALLTGKGLPVILRDNTPGIPWPNHWDLPGGGREGQESPIACVLRETREELGLEIDVGTLFWARSYGYGEGRTWFFAARLEETNLSRIELGREGQCWQVMSVADFLAHPKVVPHFKVRLLACLAETSPHSKNPPLM